MQISQLALSRRLTWPGLTERRGLAEATVLDILADQMGIDLGRAAALKFNTVSERIQVPIFITGQGVYNRDTGEVSPGLDHGV